MNEDANDEKTVFVSAVKEALLITPTSADFSLRFDLITLLGVRRDLPK
jgi:hypothetical protein